jgi:hypothetical protein
MFVREGADDPSVLWNGRHNCLLACRHIHQEGRPYFLRAKKRLVIDPAGNISHTIPTSTRFQSLIPCMYLAQIETVDVGHDMVCESNFTSNLHHLTALKYLQVWSVDLDYNGPSETPHDIDLLVGGAGPETLVDLARYWFPSYKPDHFDKLYFKPRRSFNIRMICTVTADRGHNKLERFYRFLCCHLPLICSHVLTSLDRGRLLMLTPPSFCMKIGRFCAA